MTEIKEEPIRFNKEKIEEGFLLAKPSTGGREYLIQLIRDSVHPKYRLDLIFFLFNNLSYFDLIDANDLNNLVVESLGREQNLLSIAAASSLDFLNQLLTQIEKQKLKMTFDHYVIAANEALRNKKYENFRHIYSTFAKSDGLTENENTSFFYLLLRSAVQTDDRNGFATLFEEFGIHIAFEDNETKFKKFKELIKLTTSYAVTSGSPDIICFIIEKKPEFLEFINIQLDIDHGFNLLAWAMQFPHKPALLQRIIASEPEKAIRNAVLTSLDCEFNRLAIFFKYFPNLKENEKFICKLFDTIFHDEEGEQPIFNENPPNILRLLAILNQKIPELNLLLLSHKEFSLLELAAWYNQVNALKVILASLPERNFDDLMKPLQHAIQKGHLDSIFFLLEQTKNIFMARGDSKSETSPRTYFREIISELVQSPLPSHNISAILQEILSLMAKKNILTFEFLKDIILSTENVTIAQLNLFLNELNKFATPDEAESIIRAMIIKGLQPGQDLYLQCLLQPPMTIRGLNSLMKKYTGDDLFQWLLASDTQAFESAILKLKHAPDAFDSFKTIALMVAEHRQNDKLQIVLEALHVSGHSKDAQHDSSAIFTEDFIKTILLCALDKKNVNSLLALTDLNIPLDTLDKLFLEAIIEKKIDMNAVDLFSSYTPFLLAIEAGFKKTVAWSLRNNISITEAHSRQSKLFDDIILELMQNDDLDLLELLLRNNQINEGRLQWMIQSASQNSHIKVLTLLIQVYSAPIVNDFIEDPLEQKYALPDLNKMPTLLLKMAFEQDDPEFLKAVIATTKDLSKNITAYSMMGPDGNVFSQVISNPNCLRVLLEINPTLGISTFSRSGMLELLAEKGIPETFNLLLKAFTSDNDSKKSDSKQTEKHELLSHININRYIRNALLNQPPNWQVIFSFLDEPLSLSAIDLNQLISNISGKTAVEHLIELPFGNLLEKFLSRLTEAELNTIKIEKSQNVSTDCLRVLMENRVLIYLPNIYQNIPNDANKAARMKAIFDDFNNALREFSQKNTRDLASLSAQTLSKNYYFLALCFAASAITAQQHKNPEMASSFFIEAINHLRLAEKTAKSIEISPSMNRMRQDALRLIGIGVSYLLTQYSELDRSLKKLQQERDTVAKDQKLSDAERQEILNKNSLLKKEFMDKKQILAAEIKKMLFTFGISERHLNDLKEILKGFEKRVGTDLTAENMKNLTAFADSIDSEYKSKYFFKWYKSGTIRSTENTINEFLGNSLTHPYTKLIEDTIDKFMLKERKDFLRKIAKLVSQSNKFTSDEIFQALEFQIFNHLSPQLALPLADRDENFAEKIVLAIQKLPIAPDLEDPVSTLRKCVATVIDNHIMEKEFFNDVVKEAFREIVQNQTNIDELFKKELLNQLINHFISNPMKSLDREENRQQLLNSLIQFLRNCKYKTNKDTDNKDMKLLDSKKKLNLCVWHGSTIIFPHYKEFKDILKTYLTDVGKNLQKPDETAAPEDKKKKRKHTSTSTHSGTFVPPSSPVRFDITKNTKKRAPESEAKRNIDQVSSGRLEQEIESLHKQIQSLRNKLGESDETAPLKKMSDMTGSGQEQAHYYLQYLKAHGERLDYNFNKSLYPGNSRYRDFMTLEMEYFGKNNFLRK